MSEATTSSSELAPSISDGQTADEPDPDVSTEQEESEMTLDVIFEALKNERRRLVLEYLGSETETLELGSVAEQIAAAENGKPESEITYAERKRVYVALYQCHLPKLDEMGIVEFDKSRGTIREGDEIEPLRPYLSQAPESRPWHIYYTGIVGVGAAVYVGSWLLGLLNPLTAQLTLLAVFATVAICAVSHTWSTS